MAARKTFSDTVKITNWETDIPGSLTSDRRAFEFPVVAGKTYHGNTSEWQLIVEIFATGDDACAKSLPISREIASNADKSANYFARVRVKSRIGNGNDRTVSPTFVREGKCAGRKNERNIFCQALRDGLGKYNKQARLTGAHTGGDVKICLPMLVKPRDSVAVKFGDAPVYVQRKYNGIRVVGTRADDGNIVIYSRTGMQYSGFSGIRADLALIADEWRKISRNGDIYIDGELYKHGMPLQEISGSIRGGTDIDIPLVVFDIFIVEQGASGANEMPFSARRIILEKICGPQLTHVLLAPTFKIDSGSDMEARIAAYFRGFTRDGYEGAIIRFDAPYEHSVGGYHSSRILKMKAIRDAEFKICDYTVGVRGKAEGALLFVCETEGGERFNVTPTGSLEWRKQKVREFASGGFEEWRGKAITITFDEMSERGVPQRARTDCVIRDYE